MSSINSVWSKHFVMSEEYNYIYTDGKTEVDITKQEAFMVASDLCRAPYICERWKWNASSGWYLYKTVDATADNLPVNLSVLPSYSNTDIYYTDKWNNGYVSNGTLFLNANLTQM